MGKYKNEEQQDYKVCGFIPNWYPIHSMKGMKITSEEFNNDIKIQENIRSKKEAHLKEYKTNFRELREKASKISKTRDGYNLLNDLDRCVESAIDTQLFVLSGKVFNNGLNIE